MVPIEMASVHRCVVFIVVVFAIFGCNFVLGQIDCKTETFPVQTDFNEEKFLGKWYEDRWILEPWVPASWSFFDYIQILTKIDVGYKMFWAGRWPANATDCIESHFGTLIKTDVPAKYIRQDKKPENGTDVVFNSTYWIIDTDYDNYALVYGCRLLAPNGTCVDPAGYFWTRSPKPDPSYVEKMKRRLPELCITFEDFFPTPHNKECSVDMEGSSKGIHHGHVGTILLVALVCFIWGKA